MSPSLTDSLKHLSSVNVPFPYRLIEASLYNTCTHHWLSEVSLYMSSSLTDWLKHLCFNVPFPHWLTKASLFMSPSLTIASLSMSTSLTKASLSMSPSLTDSLKHLRQCPLPHWLREASLYNACTPHLLTEVSLYMCLHPSLTDRTIFVFMSPSPWWKHLYTCTLSINDWLTYLSISSSLIDWQKHL